MVFGFDQVPRLLEHLAAPVVFRHRDGSSGGPRVQSNPAQDVVLTEHAGRMSAGDERPCPAVEALPGADRVIRRDGRVPEGRIRRSLRHGRVGLGIARDHLAVLAEHRPTHHAPTEAEAPSAMPAAFARSQEAGSPCPFQSASGD